MRDQSNDATRSVIDGEDEIVGIEFNDDKTWPFLGSLRSLYRNANEPTTQSLYVHLPPHDQRDNYNGGFSFAVYHPETSLPQQPWPQ